MTKGRQFVLYCNTVYPVFGTGTQTQKSGVPVVHAVQEVVLFTGQYCKFKPTGYPQGLSFSVNFHSFPTDRKTKGSSSFKDCDLSPCVIV